IVGSVESTPGTARGDVVVGRELRIEGEAVPRSVVSHAGDGAARHVALATIEPVHATWTRVEEDLEVVPVGLQIAGEHEIELLVGDPRVGPIELRTIGQIE